MRVARILIVCGLLFGSATAASAQKTFVDFDHNANFSQYKTFMWIGHPEFRPDPIMAERLVDDINGALTAKGLQLVTEGGDVALAAHMATRRRHTLETFYDGLGGGWGWHFGPGFGTAYTTVHTYAVGTIVVDMFDARTKQIIWRGVATETLSGKPEKDTKELEKAVDKLFRKFPPS